ncbi:hypothetical protein [Streptomyces sp. NBC_00572]|uniref:hypothetical protein n=1 Tax=Streptomyces sp. NBC_00572 TaxID=2903664 RepID=UPI002256606B|nr:hypothetical protein [Streptomyces sp. NBC_00572]MCX4984044.1 hypothetical protein [Streptomyces sp. NBC_00572]
MTEVYSDPMAYLGQGGSIPLRNLAKQILHVEEPQCLTHAPNESVDPADIDHMAHVEAPLPPSLRGHQFRTLTQLFRLGTVSA